MYHQRKSVCGLLDNECTGQSSQKEGSYAAVQWMRMHHLEGSHWMVALSKVIWKSISGILTFSYRPILLYNVVQYIRKNLITMRLFKHWNRLSSEVVGAPCLLVFTRDLDHADNNML